MVKQKENLFEIIGRRIRKKNEEKERIINKYWKLPAVERIDFDNKRKEIEKRYEYYTLHCTFIMIKVSFFYLVLVAILKYLFNVQLHPSMLNPLILFLRLTLIAFFIDVILIFLSPILSESRIKELRKRFKLV